jgi:glycosyltransferase involved in cell wall biosynthesis
MTDQRRFDAIFLGRESRTGVSEGLNVLFADLVRNLGTLGIPVAIFTTERHVQGLQAILRANGVNVEEVEIHPLIRGNKFLARVWPGLREKSKRVGWRTRISRWLISAFRTDRFAARVAWLLDGNLLTLPLKLLWLLAMAVFGAAALAAAGVFGLLGLIAYSGLRLAKKLAPVVARVVPKVLRTPDGEPLAIRRHHIPMWINRFRLAVYEQLYYRESLHFAQTLKSRRDVRTCFFFSAFEGYVVEALGSSKKKLVVFPDAVSAVFPTRFPVDRYSRNLIASVATSVRNADALVCYSNYVRDRQLMRFLPSLAADKRVEVIPQGFFLGKSLSAPASIKDLNKLVKEVVGGPIERGELQFDSFDYVLYPSVDRPHKNTLTLLKAIEHLVRDHQVNIKLITTSHGATADLQAYIQRRHLHREIIFMPMLSIEKLNSLIEGALAVVHPSLAEGGDIFNFSRAASHDCPALLSDIEVAREMFERHGIRKAVYGEWLFNPTSPKQLARKILAVRASRSDFVKEQKQALQSLSSYSFEDMAQRYYDLYRSL